MKNKKIGLLLLLSIMLVISGCNQDKQDVNQMPELEPDILETQIPADHEYLDQDIKMGSIFPEEEGFIWRYDGPIETGKTLFLQNVEKSSEKTVLSVLALKDDASGELEIDERLSKLEYIITDDEILENGRILLKAPLKIGNQWLHPHVLKDSGEVRYATTEIVKIENEMIMTETKVENVYGYPNEEYVETNTYVVGGGLSNQKFSVYDMRDMQMGFSIYGTYLKPYDTIGQEFRDQFDVVLYEGKAIKAYPIVAYNNYLIGGTYVGKWIDSFNMAPKLVGQETYKIYGLEGYRNDGLGTAAVKEVDGFEWNKVDVLDLFGAPILEKVVETPKYKDYFSQQIAFSADWDPIPRKVEQMKVYSETYRDIVKNYLEEIGFGHVPVNIKQILKTDLEGDGVDEVVISASSYDAPINFFDAPDRYSIVLLRKLIDGEVKTFHLAEDYHKKDETETLNYAYYVPFILDLNGDGRMEIIVEGMYYEGQWIEIIDVNGSEIQSVLSDGPQI